MNKAEELDRWRILCRLGQQAAARRSFHEAEEFYLRALDACRSLAEAKATCLPLCLLYLGTLYETQHKYDEAIKHFKHLLSIYSETHGTDSISASLTRHRLQSLKRATGKRQSLSPIPAESHSNGTQTGAPGV